jgi:redox-sensitive bicupin YhaK (pirin superfamily)
MSIRAVKRIVEAQPTVEGAGVKLKRAFGFGDTAETDPFLLLDDFRNERPDDYLKGFPWHPQLVAHGDSLGNTGTLGAGDIQWMTAGRGILHQEMPHGDARGRVHGFQLWANLPSSLKLTSPRYQDVPAGAIPEVTEDDGTRVRVICGSFWGATGPVDGVAAEPSYLDVWVPPRTRKSLAVDTRRNAFAYVFEGDGVFRDASPPQGVLTDRPGPVEHVVRERAGDRSLVMFDSGDEVVVQAGEAGIRFLLVSGKPLEEPVAWYGPIVMNTREELARAYQELRDGTFITP